MENMEKLAFVGQCKLQGWDQGVLQRYLVRGVPLFRAKQLSVARVTLINRNVIVITGKELVTDFLIGTAVAGLTYCAIGTGSTTPTPGDTILTAETYRTLWDTRTRITNGATLDVLIAAANCTFHVREGGVFGDTADGTPDSGTLFSHFLQDYDNSVSAYDLTFEYQLTVG